MQTKKVAIITGASRGIGHEIAYGLAEDGYNLVLIARTEQSYYSFLKIFLNSAYKQKSLRRMFQNLILSKQN